MLKAFLIMAMQSFGNNSLVFSMFTSFREQLLFIQSFSKILCKHTLDQIIFPFVSVSLSLFISKPHFYLPLAFVSIPFWNVSNNTEFRKDFTGYLEMRPQNQCTELKITDLQKTCSERKKCTFFQHLMQDYYMILFSIGLNVFTIVVWKGRRCKIQSLIEKNTPNLVPTNISSSSPWSSCVALWQLKSLMPIEEKKAIRGEQSIFLSF